MSVIVALLYVVCCVPLVVNIFKILKDRDVKSWKVSIGVAVGGPLILSCLLYSFSLYTELLWFKNLEFENVFWKILATKISFGLFFSLVAFLILYIMSQSNIKSAFKFLNNTSQADQADNQKTTNLNNCTKSIKRLKIIVFIVVCLISVCSGFVFAWLCWEKFLLFFNYHSGNIIDPIFEKDISFYLFQYPVYNLILSWLFFVLILGCLLMLAVYNSATSIIFHFDRNLSGNYDSISIRNGILALVFFATCYTLAKWLSIYDLMFSEEGAVFGVGYTDTHIRVPIYIIQMVVLVILSVFGCFVARARWRLKIYLWVTGSLGVIYIALAIFPSIFHYTVVRATEIEKEKPYLEHNIQFTRKAFKIDNVKEKFLSGDGQINLNVLGKNQDTINNVRLWDWHAFKSSLKQIQEIRSYYEFLDADVDRYVINGKYKEVMLSARELTIEQLPQKSKIWVNEHLSYTHGYGICLSLVNEFSSDGLPNLLIKDIPPVSSVPEININRPEIYYGEGTNNYVFVNTKSKEVDYPQGDNDVYVQYKGRGGVQLSSALKKLVFALKFNSIKVLTSHYLTNESRVMFYRQIQERVKHIAPFLKYDDDAYIVIADGKIYFVLDAFTTSSYYPYSQRYNDDSYGELNYIRNSVKVVIDTYNGNVAFYVFGTDDIIIRAWQAIFPDLFKPASEMPISIKKHIRYPEIMFRIQAKMYGIYHMTDPQRFFNKNDVWVKSKEVYYDTPIEMEPYFVIMRLPGEEKLEFVEILPFSPLDKNNLIAWMASRSDGEHYGELIVYKFPKNKFIIGPLQMEAKIDQDREMSGQLTLWKQKGSDVIRGNLLSIPINNSVLYIEPIFLQSNNSRLPQLTKVVVGYKEKVVWADDLKSALSKLFGSYLGQEVEVPLNITNKELAALAERYYRDYCILSGKGKLKEAGRALERLGEIIRQMQR